jgi:hypothetical protein
MHSWSFPGASEGDHGQLPSWTNAPICLGRNNQDAETFGSSTSLRTRTLIAATILAVLCARQSFAQASEEPAVVVEIGAAAERNLTEHKSSFGPTVAAEGTVIENWLELEAGVTPLFRPSSTEWTADLLFKKPWTFSRRAEFMLGVGPEWVHTNERGLKSSAFAVEVAPDFMYWPHGRHRFGWYLEPSYEYKFGPHREHSLAITGGLLIGIGRR